MPAKCCVVGCSTRAEKDDIKFYRFPKILKNKHHELSIKRQKAWLKAINRKYLEFNNLLYTHVCENHFISRRSAKLEDELHPDWVPTLNLGYSVSKIKPSLSRYSRSVQRGQNKTELCETVVSSTPDPLGGAIDEVPQEKNCDKFSQTEEFYIVEGVEEALQKKCKELEDLNARLRNENSELKEKMLHRTRWEQLKNDNKLCKYLTGAHNFEILEVIYDEVKQYLPFSRQGKI